LKAGEEIVGPINGSERLRAEVRRYAIAGVAHEQAARTWAEQARARDTGKGRKPNLRTVERAARRLGLADMTLKEATARLEALAARMNGAAPTPEELLARAHAAMKAERGDD
jgi:hypothetical protein